MLLSKIFVTLIIFYFIANRILLRMDEGVWYKKRKEKPKSNQEESGPKQTNHK